MKSNKGKYRLQFLICLNKYRIAGKFKLLEISFQTLGELIRYILDYSYLENDYEAARYCMILSQTFYCEGIDIKHKTTRQKISLQEKIETHDIWKSLAFWENFLTCKLITLIKLL